ncbi:MAG: acyltransferase family protein [Winogradskyella sp.]|uniref:acyltransferase family protein n=1 Tax=Winogradskyella sp. TaxID=1883156 RepID=UPI00385ECD60
MIYSNSFNHYRALAIVFIVAAHAQFVADVKVDTYFTKFFFNTLAGSTLNFSFISGFLFYLVSSKHYDYKTFFKSRFNRFFKPYLFLSIAPIVVSLITIPMYWDNSNITSFHDYNGVVWYIISTVKYLISGAHITAYWYIPLVMLMAAAFPLYKKFARLKLKQQLIIFFVLLVIASVVQRPYERTFVFQAIQSLIYFTPLYVMGIICAIHKDAIYKTLKGKEIVLAGIVLIFIAFQTHQGDVGLYKNRILDYNGIDTIIYKMVFMCLFFMVWLHRFEHVKSKLMSTLANTSFTIYFLHVYFIKLIFTLKHYLNISFEAYAPLAYIVIVVLLVGLSITAALIVKKLLPNHAFTLIGYGKKPLK